jgi:hypothetical protein
MTTQRKKIVTKSRWTKANDVGPHLAVLPSGLSADGNHEYVKFIIPDPAQLLRTGRIPNHLREAAIVFTSHPDGTDEMMRELVMTAAFRGPGQDTITNVISAGHDLAHVLVAEMVVEPEITAEEVAGGVIPELDVRMLLEFAERLRKVDAAGNELPIITQDEWATFRRERPRVAVNGDVGTDEPAVVGDVPIVDDGEV